MEHYEITRYWGRWAGLRNINFTYHSYVNRLKLKLALGLKTRYFT
ncbi:hypothetical protein HYPGJ_31551 [Hyphomicrobium sp. GJ21]|nr:hypothetical protein HYPGJ_31551 [Hyphomicrobium sp. GJ21]